MSALKRLQGNDRFDVTLQVSGGPDNTFVGICKLELMEPDNEGNLRTVKKVSVNAVGTTIKKAQSNALLEACKILGV